MYYIGIQQMHIMKQMQLSTHTAVDWFHFYREICNEVMIKNAKPKGGPGIRVQIDESKFGKRKYHRGHHHVEGFTYLLTRELTK